MADNIITAVFGATRETKVRPRYRYDVGQILVVRGVKNLPDFYEVHFANEGSTADATPLIGTADGVTIPDTYFQSGATIYAYIYVHDEATDGTTIYKVTIPVINRARPANIEPTPEQEDIISQAIVALNENVGRAEDSAEQAEVSAVRAESAADGAAQAERNASVHADRAEAAAQAAEASADEVEGYAERAEIAAQNAQSAAGNAEESAQAAEQSAYNAGVNASSASSAKNAAQSAASNARSAASDAASAKNDAVTAKNAAEAAATRAETAAGQITGMTAEAETLEPGSSATASFLDGVLSLGIPAGANGANGNGIVSIVKTGTSGNVDVYTITYTNGTTSTFTVTNGVDGAVTSVAGKTGAVTMNAGDVAFNDQQAYDDGTVGAGLTNLKSQTNQLDNAIGDLSELTTNVKESIVSSVNELAGEVYEQQTITEYAPNLFEQASATDIHLGINATSFNGTDVGHLYGFYISVSNYQGKKLLIRRTNNGKVFRGAFSTSIPAAGVQFPSSYKYYASDGLVDVPDDANYMYVLYYNANTDTLTRQELLTGMLITEAGDYIDNLFTQDTPTDLHLTFPGNQYGLGSTGYGFYVELEHDEGVVYFERTNIGARFRCAFSTMVPDVGVSYTDYTSMDSVKSFSHNVPTGAKYIYVLYYNQNYDTLTLEQCLAGMTVRYCGRNAKTIVIANDSRIAAIEEDVDTLKTAVSAQGERISNLETAISELDAGENNYTMLVGAQTKIAQDWHFPLLDVWQYLQLASNHLIPGTETIWSSSGGTALTQKNIWMSDGVHPYTGIGITEMYAKTLSNMIALISPSYRTAEGNVDTTIPEWNGRNILWMGTSIPAGSGTEKYPTMVGTQLNANVTNIAFGYSSLRINASTGEYTGMRYEHFIRAITRTVAECDIVAANWDSIYPNIYNAPSTLPAEDLAMMKSSSFENLIVPYLDGTNTAPDLWVIDYGHNDVRPRDIYGNQDTYIEPTAANVSSGLLAEDTYMVSNNYANLKTALNDDLPGISNKAEFAVSLNRNSFIGAYNFLVTLILRYNPFARIAVVTDYN